MSDKLPLFIKAVSAFALAYALLQTVQHWQQYQVIAAISTAFVHVPMAVFGTVAAFLTVKTNPVFSFIAAAFVCLNAAMV